LLNFRRSIFPFDFYRSICFPVDALAADNEVSEKKKPNQRTKAIVAAHEHAQQMCSCQDKHALELLAAGGTQKHQQTHINFCRPLFSFKFSVQFFVAACRQQVFLRAFWWGVFTNISTCKEVCTIAETKLTRYKVFFRSTFRSEFSPSRCTFSSFCVSGGRGQRVHSLAGLEDILHADK
jgi:hypothetical protein